MIPPTTQIVQNDIFVKEMNSDHDHLRCICDTPKVKKPKTTHLEDHPTSATIDPHNPPQ